MWCFLPSFNGALATDPVKIFISFMNTYLSLIGSVLGSYIYSVFQNEGKFKMNHILNGTLTGGIIVSSFADMLTKNYLALVFGLLMGIIGCMMLETFPSMMKGLNISQGSRVMSLHGVTGLLSGILAAIFRPIFEDGGFWK